MSIARHHAEWLSLLEVSGPFLSMPVLLRAFPQGIDADDPAQVARPFEPTLTGLPQGADGLRIGVLGGWFRSIESSSSLGSVVTLSFTMPPPTTVPDTWPSPLTRASQSDL